MYIILLNYILRAPKTSTSIALGSVHFLWLCAIYLLNKQQIYGLCSMFVELSLLVFPFNNCFSVFATQTLIFFTFATTFQLFIASNATCCTGFIIRRFIFRVGFIILNITSFNCIFTSKIFCTRKLWLSDHFCMNPWNNFPKFSISESCNARRNTTSYGLLLIKTGHLRVGREIFDKYKESRQWIAEEMVCDSRRRSGRITQPRRMAVSDAQFGNTFRWKNNYWNW